jgi:dCMP deaminase
MRPNLLAVHLGVARLYSLRSTCARRKVGCVLVNDKGHVLATGYNGVPRGLTHCIDRPCPGAGLPSGTGLEKCEANHAEMNALLQCRDVHQIVDCVCTTAPCVTCVKLLLNTSCVNICFAEDYAHGSTSEKLWKAAGRSWYKIPTQLQRLSAAVVDAYSRMEGSDPGPMAGLTPLELEIARRSGHGDKGPDAQ